MKQARRVRFGDYEADFGLRELRKCGTRVGLQHKPFHVLECLLRAPGELVSRQELVTYLWPDSHVAFEGGLNSAVNSLRQVLGESSRQCHYIETRPGLGYRFIAPVEEITPVHTRADYHAEAYQDCLKGFYLLDKMQEQEIYKALAYFKSAAMDEASSALAYSGIADAYCQLAVVGSACSASLSEEAQKSAQSALKANADSARAHVADGRVKMLFNWDWAAACHAAERALELDAASIAAHTLQAALLCLSGIPEAAIQVCRNALAIEPLSFPANLQLAACFYAARDFGSVADQCWKMLSLAPTFAPAQLLLALAHRQMGWYEEAVVEFQNARVCSACRVPAISGLGEVFALMGASSECKQALLELSEQAQCRYVSPYWRAVIHAGRNEPDDALTLLEESFEKRDPAALSLHADARFDVLRQFPRFQTLLATLAGPASHIKAL